MTRDFSTLLSRKDISRLHCGSFIESLIGEKPKKARVATGVNQSKNLHFFFGIRSSARRGVMNMREEKKKRKQKLREISSKVRPKGTCRGRLSDA